MHRTLLAGPTVSCALVLVVSLLSAKAVAQDAIQGGREYDKWWLAIGALEPSGEHPLYPPEGLKTGSTTYRCKECHGWDYKGSDGAYGSGSHYTGIPGVFGSAMTAQEMFDIIKNPDGDGSGGTSVNGHDFGTTGLGDADIWDLVEFLQTLVIDTDTYIDPNAEFVGDEGQGEFNYDMTGFCAPCHGADGTLINFGTPESPVWVGTIAVQNPWELMHKIRLGQPDGAMASWTGAGGSDQGAADIGVYVQGNLPTGIPDPIPTVSEWGMIITALVLLTAGTLVLTGRRRALVGA